MTVTRVTATVVFLGLQFLPTLISCGRAPYRSVLLAPLTWALSLTFSFLAMWECQYDTLSLNLLFGGATGVFVGGQFGSDWRRRPRDWGTRLVGGLLLLLYVVFGSLQGSGRLVRNYGPRICEVASRRTPIEEFAATPAAYAKVCTLGVLLVLSTVSGRALLPWRWGEPWPARSLTATGRAQDEDGRAGGGAMPSSPPPSEGASFCENPTAVAAMVFRCLVTGAFAATLYGWPLEVDLDDPRNVAFAFVSVRTRDWTVLLVAAIAEVVTTSVGVVAYAPSAEQTISWDDYKRHHLPDWPIAGCVRALCGCCGGRAGVAVDGVPAGDVAGGDLEAPAPAGDGRGTTPAAEAAPMGTAEATRLDNRWAHGPADVNGHGAYPAAPVPHLHPSVFPS
ncbi:hypothetical protein I4F81_007746 [Pyropia yezoensis]|uniref:Uncharacterized protein n=1 Tax=Pyropia yezoensis TaxID=2788 RepID=A0ACC3C5Y2_PYRYE|nr:hypothetical protein I4F81_007746 [Neopyropia yezoensis]